MPHVYFDDLDLTLSPLCLFDPDKNEWTRNDLIALTTVHWAADWLACYEGWLATGRWYGGGRHAPRGEQKGPHDIYPSASLGWHEADASEAVGLAEGQAVSHPLD